MAHLKQGDFAMRTIKLALAATLLLGTAIVANAPAAYAVTTDGAWRVVIITEKGKCDSAYSFNVNVANGHVNYAGGGPVQLTGTVAAGGAVKVNIAAGDKGAIGSGHLRGSEGAGTWRGRGSASECAGRWEAARR
jgi:hypothetical protein